MKGRGEGLITNFYLLGWLAMFGGLKRYSGTSDNGPSHQRTTSHKGHSPWYHLYISVI